MKFSLMFFANTPAGAASPYSLLLSAARFADKHGYEAVWTPERHFHSFGAPFPNPAVTSAALATITERIQLRAGSVIVPLHHPVRLVEEWAVVDQLSSGRVAISVASGWNANDFTLAPEIYECRQGVMWRNLETIRSLWRGEPYRGINGRNESVELCVFPRPVQPELPVWVTVASNPESFVKAGHASAHVLTFLLGQTKAQLAQRIAAYRNARESIGLDPRTGEVAVMLHTFIGDNDAASNEQVRKPLREYLRSARELSGSRSAPAEKLEEMLTLLYEQYISIALIGSVATCQDKLEQLRSLGATEIACLVDFGVDEQSVLASLQRLNVLKGSMH